MSNHVAHVACNCSRLLHSFVLKTDADDAVTFFISPRSLSSLLSFSPYIFFFLASFFICLPFLPSLLSPNSFPATILNFQTCCFQVRLPWLNVVLLIFPTMFLPKPILRFPPHPCWNLLLEKSLLSLRASTGIPPSVLGI